jgi:hypothetical protein
LCGAAAEQTPSGDENKAANVLPLGEFPHQTQEVARHILSQANIDHSYAALDMTATISNAVKTEGK